MEFIKPTELSKIQKIEILNLWNNEYPENLTHRTIKDFEIYLDGLTNKSFILMLNKNQNIKGWYLDFTRENKKWFVIILNSKIHIRGWGTKILNLAKEKESELNGWVIDHNNDLRKNGEAYQSPLNFYMKNGFKLHSESRLELDSISAVRIKWSR